ncbi:MAG: hypothetical protein F6K14_20715 [Symploca sp. SIO2C1]|nr:hypothetical protein [Symploca sp. SIO2C1]
MTSIYQSQSREVGCNEFLPKPIKQGDKLNQMDHKYVPFVQEIQNSAQGFEIKEIRKILEKHL